jgi:glycosyltransferase involved in cell wall biosynthesis
VNFPRTAVLPVVPDFSHLDVPPDQRVFDAYDDEWTNVLFVGRLIPNKRPDNLIRFVHAYKTFYHRKTRLILAGSYGGFDTYLAQIHKLIADLRVDDVHVLGQVRNEELTALYDIADLFLCASEHEGFCVPLIEAFYKRVPVLAYAATAVPATMDGGGVLYHSTDPRHVASLMNAILSNHERQEAILASQDAALARLVAQDFPRMVTQFVSQALAMPRLPAPRVAPDFWQQFKLADELETLRQTRPAAFQALPLPPDRPGAVADLGHRS